MGKPESHQGITGLVRGNFSEEEHAMVNSIKNGSYIHLGGEGKRNHREWTKKQKLKSLKDRSEGGARESAEVPKDCIN